jgi:hypothetical protein
MYYSESGLRDVVLRTDDAGNFHIQGKAVGGSTSTTIELCEIFLEYAMYCCSWCDREGALSQMQGFAQRIGRAIGEFLRENSHLLESEISTDRALEYLFQTMNAHVVINYAGAVEHLIIMDCPLRDAAIRSGLWNIELAHRGINMMCRSMLEVISPEVIVETSPGIHPEFSFTILKPEFA